MQETIEARLAELETLPAFTKLGRPVSMLTVAIGGCFPTQMALSLRAMLHTTSNALPFVIPVNKVEDVDASFDALARIVFQKVSAARSP